MFHDERPAQDDLIDLETSLAALAPRPARLSRDRLLFEAGRESTLGSWQSRLWVWRLATVAASILAIGSGSFLMSARAQLRQELAWRDRQERILPVEPRAKIGSESSAANAARAQVGDRAVALQRRPAQSLSTHSETGAARSGRPSMRTRAFRQQSLEMGTDVLALDEPELRARPMQSAGSRPAVTYGDLRKTYFGFSAFDQSDDLPQPRSALKDTL